MQRNYVLDIYTTCYKKSTVDPISEGKKGAVLILWIRGSFQANKEIRAPIYAINKGLIRPISAVYAIKSTFSIFPLTILTAEKKKKKKKYGPSSYT